MPSLVEQLYAAYPKLKSHPVNIREGKTTDNRLMEFYQPEGSSPPTIEIFSPKTTPADWAGELVSHYLVNKDPYLSAMYKRFDATLTNEQQKRLQEQYQYAQKNSGEKRSYKIWSEITGKPAYFRGYLFNQWPREMAPKLYTSDQIQMFDAINGYLREE